MNSEGKVVPVVLINNVSMTAGNVVFSFKTNTYEHAWEFIQYLRGIADEPVKPEAPVPDESGQIAPDVQAAYDAAMVQYDKDYKEYELVCLNSKIFGGVIEAYPGLPPEGDGKDYCIDISLSLTVDWEVLNNEIE